jgi:phage/plasmid-associated DNA primase
MDGKARALIPRRLAPWCLLLRQGASHFQSKAKEQKMTPNSENGAPSAAMFADAQAEPAYVTRENDDVIPPAFTDEALAIQFADRHAGDLRYVAAWGRWLSWTSTHWRFDDTLQALDHAREICRAASAVCNKPRVAAQLASAKTVSAVERLAKADRRIAATIDQWDADPWLLYTPGGIIDLQTGDHIQRKPTDYMTRITAVAPGGSCPRFLAFLATVTENDQALQDYLQRVLGYSLTGLTNEHTRCSSDAEPERMAKVC